MPIREDLLSPISEDKPSGVSLSNEPVYLKLRDLRAPNEAAFRAFLEPRKSGEPPKKLAKDIWCPKDTPKFIQLVSEQLASKSKDLEMAVWLVEALVWQEGFAGLDQGLTFLASLLETFWDTLHPQPDPEEPGDFGMRFRPIEWLGNYFEMTKGSSPILALGFAPLTQNGLTYIQYKESREILPEKEATGKNKDARLEAIKDGKTPPEEFEAGFAPTPKAFYKANLASLRHAMETTLRIEEFCNAKFTDEQPSFTRLKDTLEQIQNAFEILLRRKLETDPDPVEAPPPPEPGEADAEAEQSGEPSSAGGSSAYDRMLANAGDITGIEPASRDEAILRIVVAAAYLRKKDPSQSSSYLILRGLRWGELRSAGPDIPPVLLTAPSTEVRSRIRNLALGNRWADVLEAAEAAMSDECGRGWLDLQRYAVTALDNLGHKVAAKAIRAELKALLADYPKLPTLTLLDDTGCANPDTLTWLAANMGAS